MIRFVFKRFQQETCYSHMCQCSTLVLKQHFRGVRNTFGQFRHRRRRRRRHPDMWAIIIVPGLSRRYPGTCLCRVIIITTAVMLAAPHAVFCWRARVKVRVASESAALGLHWRAQREVCVGLGSAALTRMTVKSHSASKNTGQDGPHPADWARPRIEGAD